MCWCLFRKIRSLRLPTVVLVLISASATGCGQPEPRSGRQRADVLISITRQGQPVTVGDIDLHNFETGEGGGGALDHTGTARIPEVVLGEYIVTILPPISGALPGEETNVMNIAAIDNKYQSPEKSPWRVTVESRGANVTFDLDD